MKFRYILDAVVLVIAIVMLIAPITGNRQNLPYEGIAVMLLLACFGYRQIIYRIGQEVTKNYGR